VTLPGFPAKPTTRFAPAPTGYLHLGHVVNALYVWGIAGATDGRVVLRIEDHDRGRCRPEYERALLDDLDWLGFHADEGRDPLWRQSDHGDGYGRALEALDRGSRVYACDCSRRRIGGERYDGHCRHRAVPRIAGTSLRVRLESDLVHGQDALLGALEQRPAEQCGDLLVRDRDGQWSQWPWTTGARE
jgi:glutamyl-tRNA synthetase/glutamyl-Q tRNA(Asp) synthetase